MSDSAPASRPLSPHLQIWKFTPTMAASITQRATGVGNFAGAALLTAWLVTAAIGEAAFTAFAGFLASPLGMIALAGFVWSISFHMLNGLRYLYWDSGRGFAPKMATMTAWLVYFGSVTLTAVIFIIGLSIRAGG